MQRGDEFGDGEYVRHHGEYLRRTFIKITSQSLYIAISDTRQVADPEGAAVADVDRRVCGTFATATHKWGEGSEHMLSYHDGALHHSHAGPPTLATAP